MARRLKREIDPFNIDISLHGASASTHDRQTRVLGSFRRLVENLPELQALGIRLKLNATLTQWNAHEIDEMHQLADRFGIPLHCYTLVTERDDGDKSPQDIELDWRQKRSVLQYVADRKRATIPINTDNGDVTAEPEKRPNCGAGLTSVLIDPVGNVLPCVEWRRPVGNLHHDSIVDIWSRSTGLQEVRARNYEVGAMVDAFGDAGRQMGFCPGQAEKQTGSNTRLYPDSRLKLVFHEEVSDKDRQKQRKSA